MVVLIHDIFQGENTNALVSHVFYGEDQAEAEAVCAAHVELDEFLRAALEHEAGDGTTWGTFNGVKIRGVARILDAAELEQGAAILQAPPT